MMDKACKNALRNSLTAYLMGKTDGRSRIKSRANGLNLCAYYLWWPHHTMSFEATIRKIDASRLEKQEKDDLKLSFTEIKTLWKTEIEKTLISVAESFETETDAISESQENAEVEFEGLVLPSDLPQGSRMNISDELLRYRQLSQNEFLACKIKYLFRLKNFILF